MSRPTQRPEGAVDQLRTIPLLARLDDDALETLAEVGQWIALDSGDVLYREGEPGTSLSILLRGRLSATRQEEGQTRWLAVIEPGGVVGELAILTGQPRGANVTAIRRSLVLKLGETIFHDLAARAPEIPVALLQSVARQLRAGGRAAPPRPRVVALVPASRNAPTPQLAADLAEALPGEVAVLDARASAEALGGGHADLEALGGWVEAREGRARTVLLLADEADAAFTAACREVADLTLLVVDPAAAPLPVAPAKDDLHRDAQLVVVHHPGTPQPTGTRARMARLGVRARHHLRMARGQAPTGHAREDLFRLVRALTGTSISVAFGGGAARGLAHVGAVRALEELRVPIDLACGTSMGGIIAGEVALGRSADELHADIGRFFSDYTMLRPRLLPALSAMSDAPLRRLCETFYQDIEVEDAWRGFFTVASNLSLARPEIMDTGPIAMAVRASGAVPGMWPPMVHGQDVLVDGVVTNNLPGDLALQRCPGHGIAVNVIPRTDPLFVAQNVTLSAPRALLTRVNPFNEMNPPLVTDIGLRSLFMATVRHAEEVRKAVSVFIEPDVGRFGFLFEARRGDQIIDAGYQAALKALSAWLDTGPELPGR